MKHSDNINLMKYNNGGYNYCFYYCLCTIDHYTLSLFPLQCAHYAAAAFSCVVYFIKEIILMRMEFCMLLFQTVPLIASKLASVQIFGRKCRVHSLICAETRTHQEALADLMPLHGVS